MNAKTLPTLISLLVLGFIAVPFSCAQQVDEQKGIDEGNYNIKQSIEFGGRLTSISGSTATYDTMVDLQQGVRLFDFSTEMRSLDHHGTLIDRLFFSNSGYGGDPNQVSRLSISKNFWYSFDGSFRRDQNYWDYSLLANPLNPATPFANAPANWNPIVGAPSYVVGTPVIGVSPHSFYTRRNLQDYKLTFLPEYKVRFRIGYGRNTNSGPSFTTLHQGTEQYLLTQDSITVNQHRMGVDFRFIPRTNISYDQFWTYYKNDTGYSDQNRQFLPSLTGSPVDLGVSWNAGSNQPCANLFSVAGTINPACSAYYSYTSHGRMRINSPTEQLSLQSNYIKSVDVTARFSYTGGDMGVTNFKSGFTGRESRTNLAVFNETGPIMGRRVDAAADFGATWHITNAFSMVDNFHWNNWREPAQILNSNCSWFSANLNTLPNVFSGTATPPFACTAPAGLPAGIPVHANGSSADYLQNLDSNFLKQEDRVNLIAAQVDISPKVGAHFGYRWRSRSIFDNFYNTQSALYLPNNAARGNCALVDSTQPLTQGNLPDGCTLNSDGSISFIAPGASFQAPGETDIHENAAVFGLWARPTKTLRFNFDGEITSADTAFTRISPLQTQKFNFRASYRPVSALTITGSVNLWSGQNNVPGVEGKQHNYNYAFSVSYQPSEKWGVDLGYNYDDLKNAVLICYTATGAPTGAPACPGIGNLVQQPLGYWTSTNTGFINFTFTPFSRLTARVGATLLGTSGSEVNLTPNNANILAVPGPLNSEWYRPYAGVDYRIARKWTGRAMWDYYGYHEDLRVAPQDLLNPRNFRGNLVTLALRYAF